MQPFTFALSMNAKNAIKGGLAMSIAYGLALSFGWERPMWAGFAVMVLMTEPDKGASIKKALMRMSGTLVAVVFSLIFLGLFSQDRWLFMLTMSVYVGICTYMMAGPKNQYFWMVSAFVCVIICFDAGPSSTDAFRTAMMRAEETGLGILVYSLISFFLWPKSSITDFNATAQKIAANQRLFYRASMDMKDNDAELHSLKGQAMGSLTPFLTLLGAAQSENYEIKTKRKHWEEYQQQMNDLGELLGRWNGNTNKPDKKNLTNLISNFNAFDNEIDRRLMQIQSMLKGLQPDSAPANIALSYDKTKIDELSHIHKTELLIIKYRLEKLDELTRTLFKCVSTITEFSDTATSETSPAIAKTPTVSTSFVPDIERLKASVIAMLSGWIAFLAVIYIPDFPAGFSVISMAVSVSMVLATTPILRTASLVQPIVVSIFICSLLYIFVMPALSSYVGLGIMLFLATFFFSYYYSAPQQMLSQMFGLIMLITITAISNEQSYSFLSVTSTTLMMLLLMLILYITENMPFSTRPEQVCIKLLGRIFRASDHLLSILSDKDDTNKSAWRKYKTRFFEYELSTLPKKLQLNSSLINVQYLPDASPEHQNLFNTSLQSLAFNINALYRAQHSSDMRNDTLYFNDEMSDWVKSIRDALFALSEEPTASNQVSKQHQIMQIMSGLDARINQMLEQAGEYSNSGSVGKNLYPLLAAYQGLSYSLADYIDTASTIDWEGLLEERFV